jgi:hypothetical protein
MQLDFVELIPTFKMVGGFEEWQLISKPNIYKFFLCFKLLGYNL